MLNEKDYCDYETCVALEELGFPIRKIKVKGKETHVPILLYEAQKWLREEKKIVIVITPCAYDIINETNTWNYEIWMGDNLEIEVNDFNFYEEALSEGIKEAVKILKENETIHG